MSSMCTQIREVNQPFVTGFDVTLANQRLLLVHVDPVHKNEEHVSITKYLEDVYNNWNNVIIAGDLNASMKDICKKVSIPKDWKTHNVVSFIPKGVNRYTSNANLSLDHISVRGKVDPIDIGYKLSVKEMRKMKCPRDLVLSANIYSDHIPICAEVCSIMRVLSWNVADNVFWGKLYGKSLMIGFDSTKEGERLKSIVDKISYIMVANNIDVVSLQEVPYDMIALLQSILPTLARSYTLHYVAYYSCAKNAKDNASYVAIIIPNDCE